MTISLNLAKLMNGLIDVESCIGKGSKITASVCLKMQQRNDIKVAGEHLSVIWKILLILITAVNWCW